MSNPYLRESQFCLRFFCQVMDVIGAPSTSPSDELIAFVSLSLFLHTLLQVEKQDCKFIVPGTAVNFVSAKSQTCCLLDLLLAAILCST